MYRAFSPPPPTHHSACSGLNLREGGREGRGGREGEGGREGRVGREGGRKGGREGRGGLALKCIDALGKRPTGVSLVERLSSFQRLNVPCTLRNVSLSALIRFVFYRVHPGMPPPRPSPHVQHPQYGRADPSPYMPGGGAPMTGGAGMAGSYPQEYRSDRPTGSTSPHPSSGSSTTSGSSGVPHDMHGGPSPYGGAPGGSGSQPPPGPPYH